MIEGDPIAGSQAEPPRLPRGTFALGLAVFAVAVGAAVSAISAVTGAGACDVGRVDLGAIPGVRDPVCFDLVRTLAQREGMMAAAATVVIVLLMLGLSRMAEAAPDRQR